MSCTVAVEPPRATRWEMQALDEGETVLLLEAAQETRLYAPSCWR